MLAALALSLLAAAPAPTVPLAPPSLTLERVFGEPPLAGKPPLSPKISPAGRYATYLKASTASAEVLDLWAQPLEGGAAAGAPRPLVTAAALLGGKDQRLTEQERMALERKRISQRGITSYDWCGGDDRTLLFPFSGDLYVVRLGEAAPVVTRLTLDDAVPEQNPICDAAGRFVAYVKSGNVIVHDLTANTSKAITRGAQEARTFGLAEFIAEEELSRHEGMWWSPDGTRLLVLEVDERDVSVKVRPQIFADRTELVSQRYPAAGEKNAVVRAHIIGRAGDTTTTLALPTTGDDAIEYIARAGFFGDGRAWVQGLSRDQRRLTLLRELRAPGKPKKVTPVEVVTVERDDAWVEVHDDLRELPAGAGGGLLWVSEASGRSQLVRLDAATGTRAPLTAASEPTDGVVCVRASGEVVFGGYADRGRSRHLFVRAPDGAVRALTSGKAHHAAVADRACEKLVVTRSSWGVPPSVALVDARDGKALFTFGEAGDAADPVLQTAAPAPPQFLNVKAADGATMLNALYLPPSTTTKGPIPIITYAYGGPTGQVVAHRWARQFPLFAHWQQRGFGVFLVDTRGMAGRDRAFTRAHKDAFGVVEVADIKAAVKQLPLLVAGVDPRRVGFFGWSYGGYLAARLALDDDSPIAAAVAVAPVTDWRLYDTAYTERYIGLPGVGGDAAPYASSYLPSRASTLSRPLLLMHGTADDNVLFEHTLRLVQALEDEGKVFDLAIYPGKAHGISGNTSQLHVFRTITSFFERSLR